MSKLKIGITMRIVPAIGYTEPRDALSQEWAEFMNTVLPEASWLPVPNIGHDILNFAHKWALTGLILSGGEDIGKTPIRDETETALLDWAKQNKYPVLGICRGFQLMQFVQGSSLSPCDPQTHVAQRHKILLNTEDGNVPKLCEVNSFHRQGIKNGSLAPNLLSLATTTDKNWIEAAISNDQKQVGLMWHPEREKTVVDHDKHIIRKLFLDC